MFEYMDNRDAEKYAKWNAKWQVILLAAKSVFFLCLGLAALMYGYKI